MRLSLLFCATLLLAACGADGEPALRTAQADVTLNQDGMQPDKESFLINPGAYL